MPYSFEEESSFLEMIDVPTHGIDLKGMPKRALRLEQRRVHSEQNRLHAILLEAARTMPPDNELPSDRHDPLAETHPRYPADGIILSH